MIAASRHTVAHPLPEHYWKMDGTPGQSSVLPLSLDPPSSANIQAPTQYDAIDDPWQGRPTETIWDQIVEEIEWTPRN